MSSSGLPKSWTRAGPDGTGQRGPGGGTWGHWGLRGSAPELVSLHPCPQCTKVCPSPFLREEDKGSEDDTIHQDHGSRVGCLCFPIIVAPRTAQHPQVGSVPCPLLSPESLQPNLTLGSQTWVTPSQIFSSLESMQSVSPSQRQRMGMHSPSSRHWNSSVWQPPGGRVAVGRALLTACTPWSWGAPGLGGDKALIQQGNSWRHPEAQKGDLGIECGQ